MICLKLVAHFQEQRVFLSEKTKRLEFISSSINCSNETHANFFIPRRRISNGRIDGIISFRIVRYEYVRKDCITYISRICSYREHGRKLFYFFGAQEWPDPIFV